MPIYEYVCNDCDQAFETLVRNGHLPSCPACDSGSLQRQLSVFAVSTPTDRGADTAAVQPCGSCGDPRGPGACSMD